MLPYHTLPFDLIKMFNKFEVPQSESIVYYRSQQKPSTRGLMSVAPHIVYKDKPHFNILEWDIHVAVVTIILVYKYFLTP